MLSYQLINFKRLCNLIMIDLKSHSKAIYLTIASILVVLLFPLSHNSYESYYLFFLYMGGLAITNKIFDDLHNPNKATLYLMLPCSNTERFLSKWLFSSIGYALVTLLICYLYSLIAFLINGRPPFAILNPLLWVAILKYCILQSVVLLGAITFKKHAIVITMLLVCILSLILSIFSLFIGYIFFYPHHIGQGTLLLESSLQGWNFVFWVILAPICWYVTYLRLTEYELT
jgi:hypothetical protein